MIEIKIAVLLLMCVLAAGILAKIGYELGHSDGKQEGLKMAEGAKEWQAFKPPRVAKLKERHLLK